MGFGLGRLRLPPDHFWQMTPLELAAASRALLPPQTDSMSRTALAMLVNRFPD